MKKMSISLTDAIFRIVTDAESIKDAKGKPISSIEDCQALLNFIHATAVIQKTNRPVVTVGFANKSLHISERRARNAFHVLVALHLIKTEFTIKDQKAEIRFHSHDLANVYAKYHTEEEAGGGVQIGHHLSETDTTGVVSETDRGVVSKSDTHTYSTDSYTTEKKKTEENKNKNRKTDASGEVEAKGEDEAKHQQVLDIEGGKAEGVLALAAPAPSSGASFRRPAFISDIVRGDWSFQELEDKDFAEVLAKLNLSVIIDDEPSAVCDSVVDEDLTDASEVVVELAKGVKCKSARSCTGYSRLEVELLLQEAWGADHQAEIAVWIEYQLLYAKAKGYKELSYQPMFNWIGKRKELGFINNELELAILLRILPVTETIVDASVKMDTLLRQGFKPSERQNILQALSQYGFNALDILRCQKIEHLTGISMSVFALLAAVKRRLPSTAKLKLEYISELRQLNKMLYVKYYFQYSEFLEWIDGDYKTKHPDFILQYGHFCRRGGVVDAYLEQYADWSRIRYEDLLESMKVSDIINVAKTLVEATKDAKVVEQMQQLVNHKITYGKARDFFKSIASKHRLQSILDAIAAVDGYGRAEAEADMLENWQVFDTTA